MKATLNWIRVNPISRAHVNTTPTGNERSLERVRTDSKLCHEFFFEKYLTIFTVQLLPREREVGNPSAM